MVTINNTFSWTTFFMEAGIPKPAAKVYATKFTTNRIQIRTLPDLTKEHLKEMGICVIGDVIAILKHSKDFKQLPPANKLSNSGKRRTTTMDAKENQRPYVEESKRKTVSVFERLGASPSLKGSVFTRLGNGRHQQLKTTSSVAKYNAGIRPASRVSTQRKDYGRVRRHQQMASSSKRLGTNVPAKKNLVKTKVFNRVIEQLKNI